MNSFYWAKTAFVSLLMISSIPFKATCTGPVSALFNSLIVGITSANEGEHSAASTSNQRPLELKLADAQMLQQWIGQIARKIVVEDGIFAGNYLCCPNININAVILTDGLPKERIKNLLKEVQNLEEKSQFLKLLFSFGAMLSAEIGEQSQQYGTLRALLKAYECVGGQFKDISNFAIAAVIKSPIEKLKVDKIILESLQINNVNHRLIQEFDLLNALKISEMTPKDVINFASFIRYAFLKINPEMQRSVCNRYDVYLSSDILTYPKNPFKKGFLKINELSHSILGKDPIKYRRIAHQLLLHVKNWGPDELKKISSKKSDEEDVIKLTRREKCIFGIFTLNLLQRMAKFELFEKYFGELNMNRLVEITNENLSVYELFLLTRCNKRSLEEEQAKELKQKKKPKNDGIENSKFYPFFGEAIRIDWNIWTEIIQQIDELPKTVKSLRSKYQLAMHTESVKFENAMQIVKAKFDEKKFGLELKAKVNLEVQLFELFYSFAARLEAIVHGKNIDGTIEKSRENSKDKIRAFLAVPNCFNVPEWANKFSIFDYWMEIKEINSESQIPAIGVEIFRNENEEAKSISRENYKTLKRLNEHKFSFYESTKHLKRIYSVIWHMDEWDSEIQAEVEQHFGKYCKKIEGIARKADLNTVRYDLVLNFKLNAWKDVHDRTKDLLKKWAENKSYEERAFAEGTENVIEPTMTKEYNPKENCKDLNKKTQGEPSDYEKTVEELGEQIDEASHGVTGELDALLIECKIERGENELKNGKEKEIDTLEKELKENKESAREMSKNFGQMLENVKKLYGQKMDE
uniref:Uncharacterized protein n=1 Tax=Globodera rostochiensis TaxID=31243 RepID=A0A914ICV6_GLORO